MSRSFDFDERLAFSRGVREASDLETIKAMLAGCASIRKSDLDTDKAGIDYIAELRKGAVVFIDGKAREKGCSRWWFDGPEVALEIWSVMPGGKFCTPANKAKTGWTLSEASNVDLIYFSFDPSDTTDVFLVPFQPLRTAFRLFHDTWLERYRVATQESAHNGCRWESKCVFVPVEVVREAIDFVCEGRMRDPDGSLLFQD